MRDPERDAPGRTLRTQDDVLHVAMGDGAVMSFPARNDDGCLGWRLHYHQREGDNYSAASVIESYQYLVLECSKEEAWRRIKLLRASYLAHPEPVAPRATASPTPDAAPGESATLVDQQPREGE
jgi:hypothetical protein